MAPKRTAQAATDRNNILDVLSAMEFGGKKEEKLLLEQVLGDLKTTRAWTKQATADRILAGPGFQAFLFAVLREVKPFAAMLREVYAFLNDSEVITRRRASMFRVSSESARAALDFSLDNFPHELLATLTEAQLIGSIVELRLPGLEPLPDQPLDWAHAEASRAWDAVGPHWDNDFYDDGFHRALSYAHTVLPSEDEEAWRRLHGLVDPILDRLAAIVQCCSEVHPVSIDEVTWSQARDNATFTPRRRPAHSHRILLDQAGPVLRAPVESRRPRDRWTVRDQLNAFLHGTIISIHLFENESYERQDSNNWLQLHIGPLTRAGYLDWMEQQSADYLRKLDTVAPVVREFRETTLQERLVEFLLLPFWKCRWFLYELWTLVLVLAAAARSSPIELEGVEERRPGALEWNLPGGTASRPVATIGGRSAGVLCWAQRKTLHPGTGAGLEPDLRLTSANPAYHDLLIIENKDRRRPPGGEMREIAQRYVEGTCTEGLWLLNYDDFPAGLDDLETAWPGRAVHVVSQFRPGSVPPAFLEEIAGTLARHLPMTPAVTDAPAATLEEIAIALTWGAVPRDLDLHVRVVRTEGTRLISFRDRGRWTEPPFAELDRDVTAGGGGETVRVRTAGLRSLRIAVHNYSNEVPISASKASVVVTLDGSVTLLVPSQGSGSSSWWIVAEYDHEKAHLEVIHLLSATAAAYGFE